MSFPCPHCGGEIVVTPGMNPFPGWRNLDANGDATLTQSMTQPVTQPDIAHGSKDLSSKTSPKNKTPYNQAYAQSFLDFWAVYPLHRDKRKAQNAWRNAVARLGATVAQPGDANAILITGAMRYRDDPNRRAGFTKYAEGWLNGDGWEDEPLPPRIDPGTRPADPPRPMTDGEMTAYIERELDRG